jgi:hypothetical protein
MAGAGARGYDGGMTTAEPLPTAPSVPSDRAVAATPAGRPGHSPLRPSFSAPGRAFGAVAPPFLRFMKPLHFVPTLTVVLGMSALAAAGCVRDDSKSGDARSPGGSTAPAPNAAVVAGSNAPAATAAATGAAVADVRWADLETLTFEQRAQFLAGVRQLEAMVDRQIAQLAAKRAAMMGSAQAKDWDFAMKEMNDSRTYLRSMGEEAGKATAETWDQQKAKVGEAWVRTQTAHDKVKSSTTG